MRQKIVAGNWKMNKTLPEGIELVKQLQTALEQNKPNCRVIVAAPYIHLASIYSIVDTNLIGIASQNIADHTSGAYTGEVSASMVKSIGCDYCIIGHSERRAYYNETGEVLAEKIRLALEENLTPIFCVGESLNDREANNQNSVVSKQLQEALFSLSAEKFKGIILAYEPVWAIGTGKTATPEQANDMHKHIRKEIETKFGNEIAEATSILYGGSCNGSNAPLLFAMSDIDGGLIGGASLASEKFMPIIEAFK